MDDQVDVENVGAGTDVVSLPAAGGPGEIGASFHAAAAAIEDVVARLGPRELVQGQLLDVAVLEDRARQDLHRALGACVNRLQPQRQHTSAAGQGSAPGHALDPI